MTRLAERPELADRTELYRPGLAGRPGFAAEVGILFRRNVREGLRSPVIAFLFPVLFPLFAETLVAGAYGQVATLPGFPVHPYTAYMAPGMLLLAGMMGSGYSATALVLDAQTGFLDRLKVLNVRPGAILLSRLAFDAVRVLPAAVVVLLVSLVLGARVERGAISVVALLLICAAWSVGYGGLFYIVALTTWNPQAPLAMSPLFILLLFTSPAAVPAYLLPSWLDSLARWNPFSYVVQGVRAFMTGPLAARPVLLAVAVLVAAIAVTQAAVIPIYRRVVSE